MADIIDFPRDHEFDESKPEGNEDAFLRDEGLELLALYRSIKDPAVRASIMNLIGSLAKTSLNKPD